MPIELEKILTISASDYCEMQGKSLSDYIPVGVHSECCNSDNYSSGNSFPSRALPRRMLLNGFMKEVPENAEVVVGYTVHAVGLASVYESIIYFGAAGIALIPRTRSES